VHVDTGNISVIRGPRYPLENVNFGPENPSATEILAIKVLTFPSNAPKLGAPRGPNLYFCTRLVCGKNPCYEASECDQRILSTD